MKYEDRTPEEWYDLIDEWHKSDSSLSLEDFLQLDDVNYTRLLWDIRDTTLTDDEVYELSKNKAQEIEDAIHTMYYERIKEIVDTHPISIEGIMQVVEQVAYMSDYGIYPDQICKWLKGICHNDYGWSGQPPITDKELADRIVLSNEVIDVAQFWNRALHKDYATRNILSNGD